METHTHSTVTDEERRNYHVTDTEMTMLMKKYKLRYRTATEFGSFDNHTKRWILQMMKQAYEAGQKERE